MAPRQKGVARLGGRRVTVLLVNPPSPRGSTVNREGFGGLGVATLGNAGFVYPAQRLAEAAAAISAAGQTPVPADFVLSPRRAAWRVRRTRARGLVVHLAPVSLDADVEFCRRLVARCGPVPLVVLGVGLSAHAERLEQALPRARVLGGSTGFPAAAALEGRVEVDPDPDGWLPARWDGFPLGRGRRVPLYHARGCHHGCTYCPYRIATEDRHLVRSAPRTYDEFRLQVERVRPRRIVFRDPTFGLDVEGSRALLELLAAAPVKTPFEVETRPEVLAEPGFLRALVRAGCVEAKLGVESLEEEPLRRTLRVVSPGGVDAYRASVNKVLELSREVGLPLRLYLLEGLPGATPGGEVAAAELLEPFGMVHRKQLIPPEPSAFFRMMPPSR